MQWEPPKRTALQLSVGFPHPYWAALPCNKPCSRSLMARNKAAEEGAVGSSARAAGCMWSPPGHGCTVCGSSCGEYPSEKVTWDRASPDTSALSLQCTEKGKGGWGFLLVVMKCSPHIPTLAREEENKSEVKEVEKSDQVQESEQRSRKIKQWTVCLKRGDRACSLWKD